MYTFAETEYKWCPQCAGNIRLQATHCRFCHKPIENRLMKNTRMPAFVTVRDATEWLPSFTELQKKYPEEFRKRLEEAAAAAPPPIGGEFMEAGLPPKEVRCPHEPPQAQILHLLIDALLSLYECGESLTEICEDPRLQLLEITPQEIVAEHELRKEELEKGQSCRYCQEYVLNDSEDCRFCGGSEGKVPKAVDNFFEKTIDHQLLKEVILHESAWRTLNEADAVSQEITDKNGCSKEDIEKEILRQEAGQHEMPMPRFTKRMVELNLASYFSPEQLCLMAISDLGSALSARKENRSDEALIVYEHALRRTEGRDELMHDRGRMLGNLATFYLQKQDDAKYKLYNTMSHECEKFGMTEEMQAIMDKSHESLQNMFKDGGVFDDDPEKRLSALEAKFSESKDGIMSDLLGKMEETLPGLGEVMAGLSRGMEKTVQTSRLILEAQVAQKNGDLEEATKKYSEALEGCEDDRFSGTNSKISILCRLGEIKQLQGNNSAAEPLFLDALASANEYVEAEPSLGKSALWATHLSYGNYLKEVGKFEESEQNYQKALTVHEECTAAFMERFASPRADFSSSLAEIEEKYAQLLRAAKRDEEAEKMESEAAAHKKEAEDRKTEISERKKRLHPE